MIESMINRHANEKKLELVRALVTAWWPARYKHVRARIGYLILGPGRKHPVEWIPNYGVVCPSICTSNGSWAFLVECCEDEAVFEPDYEVLPDIFYDMAAAKRDREALNDLKAGKG
jgi:hypothetical protein